MKHYESPELVELGDAVELTLGTRPGEVIDQAGAEYNPPYPTCGGCGGCGGCVENPIEV
jgi:hypothetical protein